MTVEDVSAWAAIRAEEMGRDERKTWISQVPEAPRDEWWLWKPCQTTGDGSVPRLDHVAEVVTYELTRLIGLPSAECRLATRDGETGVISRNVAPHTTELVHGSSAIDSTSPYGLTSIAIALQGARGPAPFQGRPAMEVFAGYLVLDAWIANTDRHGENWGVLVDDSGSWTLAPAFDHGSALGSGLTDENRMTRNIAAFCRKGRTRHFEEGGTLLHLADVAVELSGATVWAERIADLQPEAWAGILEGIEGLSEIAGTFMNDLLRCNQERVRTLCRR